MRKLLLFLYLVIHTFLAVGQGCPGPSQRTALINLQRANIVEGSRAGQIPLSDTCGNLRYGQYVEVNLTPIAYVPTATGNTENLSEFVETPAGDVWYIDWQGQAVRLTPEKDRDWLKISDNSIPYAISDSIYTDNYAAINMRVVWPKAQFLYGDSTSTDGANGVAAGLRDARIGFKRLVDSAAFSSIGQEGRTLTGRIGPQTNSFRIVKVGGVQPTGATVPFRDIFAAQDDSLILLKDYPYTRVDTFTPYNFLHTDEQGFVRSALLSDLPFGGDVFARQGLTKINDTLFLGKKYQSLDPVSPIIDTWRAIVSKGVGAPWGAIFLNDDDWNMSFRSLAAADSASLQHAVENGGGVTSSYIQQEVSTIGLYRETLGGNNNRGRLLLWPTRTELYHQSGPTGTEYSSYISLQDSVVSLVANDGSAFPDNSFEVRNDSSWTNKVITYHPSITDITNFALTPRWYVDSVAGGGGGGSYSFGGGLYKQGDRVTFGRTYDFCNESIELPEKVDSTQVVYIDNQDTDCPDNGVGAIILNSVYGEDVFAIWSAPDSTKLLDWMNGSVTPTGDDTYTKFGINRNEASFKSRVDGYENTSQFNEYGFNGNYSAPNDGEANTVTYTSGGLQAYAIYSDFGVEYRQGALVAGNGGVILTSQKGVSNIAVNYTDLRLIDSTYTLYAQTSGGAIQNTSTFRPSGSTHSKKMAYTIDPAFTQDRDIVDRKFVNKPPYTSYNLSGSATGTVNLTSVEVDNLIYNGAGTITSLTINLPSSPADGQRCDIAITSPVTSLTMGGGTIRGNTPSSMTDVRALSFKYYTTASAWVITKAGY